MRLPPPKGQASRWSGDSPVPRGRAPLRQSTERQVEAELRALRSQLLRAASRTLPPDDAEDACQEALGRSWCALRRGQVPTDALRPYTFGIFRNVLREAWRVLQRRRAHIRYRHDNVEDEAMDPLSALVRKEGGRRLTEAVASLPATQRDVIAAVLDGVSCKTLSAASGVSADTIRQRKHRGLRTLARHLQDE
jgi:RNA polymerase sigma factor (sigma-70 family)